MKRLFLFAFYDPQGIVGESALRYLEAHPERKTEDPAFDNWCDRVIEAAEDAKKRFQ